MVARGGRLSPDAISSDSRCIRDVGNRDACTRGPEPRRRGAYVAELTPAVAAAVRAVGKDPASLALYAISRGDAGRVDALQLWTTWPRAQAARLVRRPRVSLVSEALAAGLDWRL